MVYAGAVFQAELYFSRASLKKKEPQQKNGTLQGTSTVPNVRVTNWETDITLQASLSDTLPPWRKDINQYVEFQTALQALCSAFNGAVSVGHDTCSLSLSLSLSLKTHVPVHVNDFQVQGVY